MLLVLVDVVLALLHLDVPAPLERAVQRTVWRLLRPLTRGRDVRARRRRAAASGPLMVTAVLVTWGALLVTGFALLTWPHLPTGYGATPGFVDPGLAEALYVSGVTLTTLGTGGAPPVTTTTRFLTVACAAAGFFLLAATVTYLSHTLRAVAHRNALALQVHSQTGGTGDGVELLTRSLGREDVADCRDRILRLAADLRGLQEEFHSAPVLAFHYRTTDPDHDPEPLLQASLEATLAAHLVPDEGPTRRLHPSVEELDAALTHFMRLIARQTLDPSLAERLDAPRPGETEYEHLRAILTRLQRELPAACRPIGLPQHPEAALRLAYRGRVFLDALDDLTGWRHLHETQPRPGNPA